MVKDRRATFSPMSHLDILNALTDRRYQRRALSEDELRKLMAAARDGRELFGRDKDGVICWRLSGSDRSVLYRLAVETGLRAGEIRSLTPRSFDLNFQLATVTVLAAYSKHRRDDTLPLRPSTAAMLREFFSERNPDAPVFSFPRREELARVLRVDLEAAGIPVRDAHDRVVDFHALRHTFITNLANGGVHPKTAQALARHSTITLTMDRYSHSKREDEVRALSALPDLSPSFALNNGTDNGSKNSASGSAETGGLEESDEDSERLKKHVHGRTGNSRKHGKNLENPMAPVGFEPTRPVKGQRILSPLRLPFRHGAWWRFYGRRAGRSSSGRGFAACCGEPGLPDDNDAPPGRARSWCRWAVHFFFGAAISSHTRSSRRFVARTPSGSGRREPSYSTPTRPWYPAASTSPSIRA